MPSTYYLFEHRLQLYRIARMFRGLFHVLKTPSTKVLSAKVGMSGGVTTKAVPAQKVRMEPIRKSFGPRVIRTEFYAVNLCIIISHTNSKFYVIIVTSLLRTYAVNSSWHCVFYS